MPIKKRENIDFKVNGYDKFAQKRHFEEIELLFEYNLQKPSGIDISK